MKFQQGYDLTKIIEFQLFYRAKGEFQRHFIGLKGVFQRVFVFSHLEIHQPSISQLLRDFLPKAQEKSDYSYKVACKIH